MTAARDDGRPATGAAPGEPLRAVVVLGLGAALAWSSIMSVSLGASRSGASGLTAFACASWSTVPFVIVARLARGGAMSIIVLSAPMMILPLAVLGSLIQTRTHHRALGAVTFAACAVLAIVVAFLVARRIVLGAATGAPVWRVLRIALVTACAASVAWLLWTLTGPSSSSVVRGAAVDAALGLTTAGVASRLPGDRLPSLLVRAAPALLAALLGSAVVAAWKNAPSFAVLCERAPVTVGILGLFACR